MMSRGIVLLETPINGDVGGVVLEWVLVPVLAMLLLMVIVMPMLNYEEAEEVRQQSGRSTQQTTLYDTPRTLSDSSRAISKAKTSSAEATLRQASPMNSWKALEPGS